MRLGPVVQKMDMTIHRISIRETTCAIQWIALSTFRTTGAWTVTQQRI